MYSASVSTFVGHSPNAVHCRKLGVTALPGKEGERERERETETGRHRDRRGRTGVRGEEKDGYTHIQ